MIKLMLFVLVTVLAGCAQGLSVHTPTGNSVACTSGGLGGCGDIENAAAKAAISDAENQAVLTASRADRMKIQDALTLAEGMTLVDRLELCNGKFAAGEKLSNRDATMCCVSLFMAHQRQLLARVGNGVGVGYITPGAFDTVGAASTSAAYGGLAVSGLYGASCQNGDSRKYRELAQRVDRAERSAKKSESRQSVFSSVLRDHLEEEGK